MAYAASSPRPNHALQRTVPGSCELLPSAAHSMGSFNLVLAACKAFLEYWVALKIVADHSPDVLSPRRRRVKRRYFSGPFEQRIVGGAGHFLHLEKPDVVETMILEWLSPSKA